ASAGGAALGPSAGAVVADVTRAGEATHAVSDLLDAWDGLDGLVNNAGWGYVTPTLATDEAEWDLTLALNLTAPWRLSRQVAPRLGPGGAIVNIASIYGVVAAPDRAGYCASKAGLVMLTKVLALEWARAGIRVNAVAPGYVESAEVAALADAGKIDLARIAGRTPMGRLASADEVARAVCFLLDPAEAGHVTGQVLGVDGGWAAYGYV
ncbi:MAG: SDR family oxidoreductase, partial [Alphaproteobacteria bacterium]